MIISIARRKLFAIEEQTPEREPSRRFSAWEFETETLEKFASPTEHCITFGFSFRC